MLRDTVQAKCRFLRPQCPICDKRPGTANLEISAILSLRAGVAQKGRGTTTVVEREFAASARALPALDSEPSPGDVFWAGNLLETKLLAPRVPSGFLIRPRVSRLFEAGVTKPLTVISAGPGWGKTLATAAWAVSRA